jgi:glucoamylase
MALLIPLVFVAYFVLYAFAFSIPPAVTWLGVGHAQHAQEPLQDSLDSWLAEEEKIALDKLLANVAPLGKNVQDAAPGSVIASPSREHPNYFYQCMSTEPSQSRATS